MTKVKITDNNKMTQKIIKNHMIWAMGAGAIPIPIIDIFAITAIQLDMVKQLSKVYDIDYKENEGKAVITSLVGTSIGQIGTSVIKLVPIIGSLIGGISKMIFAGATTYAIGEVFKKHFETGGTFLDFDPERLREFYHDKFEKGKHVAEDIHNEHKDKKKKSSRKQKEEEVIDIKFEDETKPKETPESKVDHLMAIVKMKKNGVLTEKEFKKLKKQILNQ